MNPRRRWTCFRRQHSCAPTPCSRGSEDVRLVRAALARLPDKYRVPLVYAAIDELDYPTIADMLGVTVGAVKTLVFRGKRMLKDEIGRAR